MGYNFIIPETLDEVKNHKKFEGSDAYEVERFDSHDGKILRRFKDMGFLNHIGFIDVNPVFDIVNLDEFSRYDVDKELDKNVSRKLKSVGTMVLIYKDNEIYSVIYIEDWKMGCIPDNIPDGQELKHAERQTNEIIESINKSLPDKNWETYSEGYDNVIGGTYGQTQFLKVDWDSEFED